MTAFRHGRKAVVFLGLATSMMPTDSSLLKPPPWPLALLSALVPGLGQAAGRRPRQATLVVAVTVGLLGASWVLGQAAGPGGAIFFLMLLVLPWWAVQTYDAWLAGQRAGDREGWPLRWTLRHIWGQAHDIHYLGALFLLTAATDLWIIVANPEYALTVFCQKPQGALGVLAKVQSPTLHLAIGYGFLRLRRWSLFLYLAYAGFGLLNATANYACFGYGRVRTVFLLTLLLFTAYVLYRRERFEG